MFRVCDGTNHYRVGDTVQSEGKHKGTVRRSSLTREDGSHISPMPWVVQAIKKFIEENKS